MVINKGVLDNVGHERHIKGIEEGVQNELLLAGIEPMKSFFIAAGVGLRSAFVLKILLIVERCFSCC